MTPEQIIHSTRESASEWLEMSHNPDQMLVGILATKIIDLQGYIEYLERRLLSEIKR